MNIWSQKSASIQLRTDRLKFRLALALERRVADVRSVAQSLGEARRRLLHVGSRARPELQRIHNRPRPGAVERGPEGLGVLIIIGLRAAMD